jgi:hypothetical protein
MKKMQQLLDKYGIVHVLNEAELQAAHDYLFAGWSKAGVTFGQEVDELLEYFRDLTELHHLKTIDALLHYLRVKQVRGVNRLLNMIKKDL